jgi:signal transduction histidine kinase
MKGKGDIWFKTIERKGVLFTEFCIGNNGSYISKESITKIFDAFYTHNKKGVLVLVFPSHKK